MESKIKKLFDLQPSSVVLTSLWLTQQGYSQELLRHYRNSNWLTSIGTGAMIRTGDSVDYLGAISAIQHQLKFPIHPGGKTALHLLGRAHYLAFDVTEIHLFGKRSFRLPSWFRNYDWGVQTHYYTSSFLPADLGLIDYERDQFTVAISSPVRAMMECLYLAPEKQDLFECLELMEGLNNIDPEVAQQLLERCQSVKVKRLFLYLAEKVGHPWFKYIEKDSIFLGTGSRSVAPNGVYINKYKLTVPVELEGGDETFV